MSRVIHQPQQEESALARRRCIASALFAAALLLCGILLIHPPTQASLYPACPIHEYLGILCPGCGATRALAALLRGRFAEAMHFNALLVILLPIALVGALETYRRALKPERFRWPQPPAPAIYAAVAATAIFTLVRNLK
jgi:hypothetical protein